jgi:hypothetical protein
LAELNANSIEPDRPDDCWPGEKSDFQAFAAGLLALALALIPPGLLWINYDEGPRGAWNFVDARQWVGFAWFAQASVLLLIPVLLLIRIGRERARSRIASLPAMLALAFALMMIPGAAIQILWWISA